MGINGFGRIGRLVFRAASGNPDADVPVQHRAAWCTVWIGFWKILEGSMRGAKVSMGNPKRLFVVTDHGDQW
eukprot:Skav203151  [mRNA]  locus=scaffold626:87646:88210:+ [translate_table: standard]